MDEKSIFAVVDLETTAPFKEGGHIIEIGISYIHNWKIIHNFHSMVNPGVKIPDSIVNLTGITDHDVVDAPYFEEIGPLIRRQLFDTVFIAHNVRYDYPYLNGEFSRIKMPRLRSQYIDTVQLAQVLFPTFKSYKLDKLVKALNIKLVKHHRADQDAIATAKLFLLFRKKICDYSPLTIHNLRKYSKKMIGNTENFFYLAKGKGKVLNSFKGLDISFLNEDKKKYFEKIKTVNKHFQQSHLSNLKIPKLRKRQFEFADKFSSKVDTNPFISIFIRPRFGKTNGYLLIAKKLLAFKKILIVQENIRRRVAISEKILKQFPKLAFYAKVPITRKDFINLDHFRSNLKSNDSPGQQIAKLRVLSWLSKTTTGYLPEISNGFPESLYDLFSGYRKYKYDLFSQLLKKYHFPRLGIVDLRSFLLTTKELSNYYDLIIFDVGKRKNKLLGIYKDISSSVILITQVKSKLKKGYSDKAFKDPKKFFST